MNNSSIEQISFSFFPRHSLSLCHPAMRFRTSGTPTGSGGTTETAIGGAGTGTAAVSGGTGIGTATGTATEAGTETGTGTAVRLLFGVV